MSSNKRVKQRLIELYGAKCFIEKLGLRRYDTPVRYTSKGQLKRMKQLTYHHIKMKKDGGSATVDNGALLSAENHQWFHQQPKVAQDKMNQIFQDYKRKIDENRYQKCEVSFVDDLKEPKDFTVDVLEIEIGEKIIIRKFNRAKEHEKTRKLLKEYEKGEEYD